MKNLAITLAALLALLLGGPCLVPLSRPAAAEELPFANSAVATINGMRFHYRTYAPESSPTGKLLLVHGLGGSTFSFEETAPELAGTGFFVLSADLPGFGYSSRDPEYDHSQKNRAADLWSLLAEADAGLEDGLTKMPWYLGGHSMGGGTVAAMAMENPARVKGLILIDPALFEAPRGGLVSFPPVLGLAQVALERLFITEGSIRRMLASAYGREPTQAQVQGYLAPLRLPGTARALSGFVRTSKNENPARLSGLGTPILAVWGSEDAWVPISDLKKLRETVPGIAEYVVFGAGHCPMETHPQEFVAAVSAWIAGLD